MSVTPPFAERPVSPALLKADAQQVAAVAFAQCATAVYLPLITTPIGWLLVVYLSWDRAPHSSALGWAASTTLVWLIELYLLRSITRGGAQLHRHAKTFLITSALNGLCWGLMAVFLMGYSTSLDALLVVVMCGIVAINSQVFIAYPSAFHVQAPVLWVACMVGLLRLPDRGSAVEYAVTYTVFMVLMAYYMKPVAARLSRGISLQLANATLAEQLRIALSAEQHDATTDPLTGQGNRRALDALLARQMAQHERTGQAFSVLMLDIDFFKKINDQHGHQVGDDALRAFALRVREHLRQGDVCTRYGGEEFVVVLPGAALPKAMEVAERIRQAVSRKPLLSEPNVSTTVSIGAASLQPGQSPETVLQAADAAVYAAKRGGRDQVQT